MKYVGATNGFIRLPFVVEGIIIGTVSAVITFRAVSVGYVYVFDYISRQATGFFAMLSLGMVPYTKIMPFMGLGFLLYATQPIFAVSQQMVNTQFEDALNM